MASNESKRGYWERHFADWQASGLTRREYCRREGLAQSTFDYWRRKARKEQAVACVSRSVPVAPLTLVPVRMTGTPVGHGLALYSPAGWQLTLPAGVGSEWLADLLRRLP